MFAVSKVEKGPKLPLFSHSPASLSVCLIVIYSITLLYFFALHIGILLDLEYNNQMVDEIVKLRESRDGLVETPQQYAFLRDLLHLRKTVGRNDMYDFGAVLLGVVVGVCVTLCLLRPREKLKIDWKEKES